MDISDGVSIIVPIYNAAKYLRFTLDSILSQTYTNYELILVNDGSTDDTELICFDYAKHNEKVYYFYKTNGGLSSARNYGILHARGKWLSFVDSDDYLCPDFYETLIKSSVDSDYDVIISTFRLITREKLVSEGPSAVIKIGGINELSAQNFEECKAKWPMLDGIPGVMGMVWKKLYRKDVITKYDLSFTTIQSEDELFDLQYCGYINSFRSIKYAGYCYIDASGSMCKLNKNIVEHDWISAVWQSYEIIKKRFEVDDEAYWNNVCFRMLVRYSAYIRKGYFKDTRIPYKQRIARWNEVVNDSYFKKMRWKHTWTISTKVCYILSKFKLYYIGDFILLMIDGRRE